MSSCIMKNPDSDEEVDLEALRLAALKSRKPKYARVNHHNLIPIVPVAVEPPDFVNTKIKVEKVSPTPEDITEGENKVEGINKENEDEKGSNYSGSTLENDQDILSMDDKEEEDSLERLMDQLEAEISGKAPIPTNRIVLSSKNSSTGKKDKRKKPDKNPKEGDDEIELVQVKTGREPGAIIEIRESASPETQPRETDLRRSGSPRRFRSPGRRSRSMLRSRSRSPFSRAKSYRRSRSPYWSRSPHRSRSPFRRSRSPYWLSRRTRSSSRKSRSPFRRYRSPGRKRSPFSRFSRSRSRSFERRRSPWSLSPRGRSKSPFYRDGLPPLRRRNFNSPPGRGRRSFSPRDGSKSPRRRSRSPRRFPRTSPYRRSKSPFRRSRSPFRRSPVRRSQSPFLRRSKSPLSKLNSPLSNRSPLTKFRHSKTPIRRSLPRSSSKPRSKSPVKRYDSFRRSGSLEGRDTKSLNISTSPTRRNRSPLKIVEKNKLDGNEKHDRPRGRNRNEKRHRSLSRENNRTNERRPYRQRQLRRFSPSGRSRRSAERQRKGSPKPKETFEKNKEEAPKEKGSSPAPALPPDPVLEARKKKFENLNEVDPSVDKKISLKSIKESTENAEDDEDALTINIEGNLWDESEESEDEFESRFKSGDTKKNRSVMPNRTVLSFRNLREGDAANKKISLNKPLTDELSRRERFNRSDRHDPWQSRRSDRSDRRRGRSDHRESSRSKPERSGEKNNSHANSARPEKRSDHKPIVWSSKNERKSEFDSKDNEVSTTHSEVKETKNKFSEKKSSEGRDKEGTNDVDVHETDDFDKLISDFEKELESDICISTKDVNSTVSGSQEDVRKPTILIKRDLFEPKVSVESTVRRPGLRTAKPSEGSSNKTEKNLESETATVKVTEQVECVEDEGSRQEKDGPEDYIEDDDFVLEVSAGGKRDKGEEEDNQSDLRAVLSRRRNERLTKAVSLQENMPTRLVQSAFQGLGNKKSKRQVREVPEAVEFPPVEPRNVKNPGVEGRRVLLLQREKNLSVQSVKCTVPEVKPDTTIYQRFTRSSERRKRKLQRQLNPAADMDQEEEEEEGFEVEEEKQSRRFRLKRNVTLSSQIICFILFLVVGFN